MSKPTPTPEFEQWFAAYWAGPDKEDPVPVPLSGDWAERCLYESQRAVAWAAWQASKA